LPLANQYFQISEDELSLDMTVESGEFGQQGASDPALNQRRELEDGKIYENEITEITDSSATSHQGASLGQANLRGSFLSLSSEGKQKRKLNRKYLSSIGSIRMRRQLSFGGLNKRSSDDTRKMNKVDANARGNSECWLPATGW